jgi:hypothetical protein
LIKLATIPPFARTNARMPHLLYNPSEEEAASRLPRTDKERQASADRISEARDIQQEDK